MIEKGGVVGAEANAYLDAKQKEYYEAKNALATVNLITATALETRINEKAYMLDQDQSNFDTITRNITTLLESYDQLEKLKPDATELKQITDARKATKEYFDAAKKWVEIHKNSAAAAASMQKNFDTFTEGYKSFIAKKDKDYRAAVKEDAKTNAYDTLQAANTVAVLASDANIFASKYLNDGKAENWNSLTDKVAQIVKTFGDLRMLTTDVADRHGIDTGEKAVQDYLASAKIWADYDRQLKTIAAVMDDGGETVAKAAAAYQKSKTALTDKIAESVFIGSDVAQTVLTIRRAARNYMMTRDPKSWTDLSTNITRMQTLLTTLRGYSISTNDNLRIDRCSQLTTEYSEVSKKWQQADNNLNDVILSNMNIKGDVVIANAQQTEGEAWKDSDSTSTKVRNDVSTSKLISIIALLVGLVVGVIVAFMITRSITKPLQQGVEFSGRIAKGDLSQKLDIQRSDEIGQLAQSMNGMVDGLRASMTSISQNAQSLGASSEQLSGVSTQVSSNAEETANQANVVSAAAEQVSKNITTVSTGAEEMTASIREIAKNATEAAKIANHAADVAESTNANVAKLGESSNQIGNVIKVITSIAEQTNLLALNATIEAARAGEAGKGFAVVANEVKELAKQTAKATEEISAKIKGIQDDTQSAVVAIKEISGIIGQINQIQTVIASSVEEQAATTNEISRNVSEAAKGASEIARNIGSVSQAAKGTTEGASQTATAARELARLAADLKRIVDQFKLDADGSTHIAAAKPARQSHPSLITHAHTRSNRR